MKIAGLPEPPIEVLRLMCPGLVVAVADLDR
jgi:hypothetical protein